MMQKQSTMIKKKVAESILAANCSRSRDMMIWTQRKEDGTTFVFMGHGTSHTAKVAKPDADLDE